MKALLLFVTLFTATSVAELTIYSDRNPAWFNKAIKAYEAKTGDSVVILQVGAKQMVQRLIREGDIVKKDLIFSKDLAHVTPIVARGLTQPMPAIEAFDNIPAGMLSNTLHWAAFTFRARGAIFNTNEFLPEDLSTYQDLALGKWEGHLCLRQGTNDYNVALVGSFIEQLGPNETLQMMTGWIKNLAQPVFAKDSHVIAAVADGSCGVGIVNHYYLAQQISKAKKENRVLPVAFKYLNQGQGGTHTSGTSVMMSSTSRQPEAVKAFLQELYTDESLIEISNSHFDYPASTKLLPQSLIKTWGPNGDGSFEKQGLDWETIGKRRGEAFDILDAAGWE